MININLQLKKSHLIYLTLLIVLIAGGLMVSSYGGTDPTTMGHSSGEIPREVPIGTILPYHLSVSGADSLATIRAAGFALCDGTTPASQGVSNPIITAATPNLNSVSGYSGGRFLRGSTSSGAMQAATDHAYLSGTNGLFFSKDVPNTPVSPDRLSNAISYRHSISPSSTPAFSSYGRYSSRPVNMAVVWIIKVK